MNAIDTLLTRVSVSKLTGPVPDDQQRQQIFSAALRAADHGRLQPWRFLVIEGEGLVALGGLFAAVAHMDDPDLSESALERYRHMPMRAPMIIVAIARCQPHAKVPEIEQQLSAAAAVQNMLNAAFALGLGAIWRTGEMAYHPEIRRCLGLGENEHLIGYLYLGVPAVPFGPPPTADWQAFFTPWSGADDCV